MIIVQTPLRISFAGGGTDFNDFYTAHGGAVLSTTINKYVYVILKERFDDDVYVNYSKKEIVHSVDDIKHELVREAMRLTGVKSSIEITTLADVPSGGTGLGSSSSIMVALLHAFHTYQDELVTAEQLAEEACHIEIDILKKPIGRQDQYISAYGNMQFITFNNSDIKTNKIELSLADRKRLSNNLLLFFTGVTRDSITILNEQQLNIEHRLDTLLEMKLLAYKVKDVIVQKNFDDVGVLLHQDWELKKGLANKISNTIIDQIYETALKAGAIGGKISGAGGGGFLLLYCQSHKQEEVRKALSGLKELYFNFEQNGSKVIFDYRRPV